ncbi:pyridoxal-phosphate dependent enzyme [Agromyces aerolatus]|uniref:pyridoxal-phosphate dependent enzyme n=1 Tax=Agromyces sp. LY-1074 TaxID=3074080 RepID=UPI00285FD98E|nr:MULTISPECIES: pyridoxal-phosphate dependent enzyme [unclassified Agromyces]MDR5699556.1 pyridoxal-phosphate dependent enzyme [Agromyces sp. LY-1074]MDR5705852.1 pyridoxal-phosphate dependent enzyme [Agromyces sp. LY-1358]
MNVCQSCGADAPAGAGLCPRCGGVCLRRDPWIGSADASSATPLVRSRIPELNGAWLKFEGANPSGSFKDRVMGVLMAEALEAGARGAVVASSGNAAVAAASAAARAGLPLLVLVPSRVPEQILRMVALRGASVVRVGEGPAAVHGLAKRIASAFDLPNLASTFAAPGCEWACRGIGAEIVEQVGDGGIRTVAAAVSVGPVLLGTANGVHEAGLPRPRMVAGQAAGCAPIAAAFARGDDTVAEWSETVSTRATSIADRLTGYADEATFFLREVRAGDGFVGAADDGELHDLRSRLARYDGLDVELSSCAAPAALIASGHAGPDAVCVLTGAGLKETLAPEGHPPDERGALEGFCRAALGDTSVAKEVESWMSEYR